MSAGEPGENQLKKDLNARRVRNIEQRLSRVRDLAISLSNPSAARAELGAILGDPSSYAAVMINHHLHNMLMEITGIISRKTMEREAMLEEMGRRRRPISR